MTEEPIEQAIRALITAIGEDPDRDGLVNTPARVARSWFELSAGVNEDPDQHLDVSFDVEATGMVLVKDIHFQTVCEHHLLPFYGVAHIAYIPDGGKVTGLSKLARCLEGYSRRLQVQERLTTQVANAIEQRLQPKGVAVMIQAEHMCMTMRGIRKPGASTVTTTYRGNIDKAEFLELVRA